jgi:hypothetical protein
LRVLARHELTPQLLSLLVASAARTSASAATERSPLPLPCSAPRPSLHLPSPRALGMQPTFKAAPTRATAPRRCSRTRTSPARPSPWSTDRSSLYCNSPGSFEFRFCAWFGRHTKTFFTLNYPRVALWGVFESGLVARIALSSNCFELFISP